MSDRTEGLRFHTKQPLIVSYTQRGVCLGQSQVVIGSLGRGGVMTVGRASPLVPGRVRIPSYTPADRVDMTEGTRSLTLT